MRWRSFAFLLCAGMTFVPPLAAQSPAGPGLEARLSFVTPEARAQGPFTVHFTLTNTSDRDLAVLKWHTPLEGFRSDMFRVERDGTPAPYLGILVKRGAPIAEDIVVLPKGGSVSADVDLLKAYGIYKPGDYTVQFVSLVYVVESGEAGLSRPDHGLAPATLRSSPVHFKLLEPRAPSPAAAEALKPRQPAAEPVLRFGARLAPVFDHCSADQVEALNNALDRAALMSASSSLVMWLTPVAKRPSVPYKTWFGDYDVMRYDRVAANFNAIYRALAHETITFRCSDTTEADCHPIPQVYAFVAPAFPYDIFICPLYWKTPPTGIDSQADTLVHEISHFNVVAKTRDHTYGAPSCKWLADHDPAKTVDNADSYGYFADSVTP
jgi:peptidyl-Lys metalloendopeptidase